MPDDELEGLLDDALARRLITLADLRTRLQAMRTRGRKGTGILLAAIRARDGTDRPSGSRLQTRLRRALAAARLPVPQEEYRVVLPDGTEKFIDYAYPDARVALECDSYRYHSTLEDWSSDRIRNNELQALGWRVISITYENLVRDPAGVADLIARALSTA